jgi:hypothetical protein
LGRLFITPREIDLVNDLTKELIKDVVGQKIYYYSISLTKTKINTLYDEAPEKIFENPVEINCFVNYKEPSYNIGKFGVDETQNIEAYIQYRDLVDKGIEIDVGDFFSYGDVFFEITSATKIKELFGGLLMKNTLMKMRYRKLLYSKEDLNLTKKVSPVMLEIFKSVMFLIHLFLVPKKCHLKVPIQELDLLFTMMSDQNVY